MERREQGPSSGSASRAPTRSRGLPGWLLVLMDVLVVALALQLATGLRSWDALDPLFRALAWTEAGDYASWGRRQTALFLYQAVTIPMALYVLGQYRLADEPAPSWSFPRIVLTAFGSFALLLAMLFTLRFVQVPRSIVLLDFVFLVAGLSLWRSLHVGSVHRNLARGEGLRNVLIAGAGPLAQSVAKELVEDHRHARRVVGFVAPPGTTIPGLAASGAWVGSEGLNPAVLENVLRQPKHILAPVADYGGTAAALDGLHVEEVLIAPDVPRDQVKHLIRVCQERGVDVQIVPDHYEDLGVRPRAWNLGRFTLLDVHQRPISRLAWLAKRAIDVAGATIALLVATPVLFLCAIAIKLEDPRTPVFYRGRRVGLNGRHFRQWKLSTMVRDADKYRDELAVKNAREGPWFKLEEKDDPRISRVGRLLRKYSLNDLPQFLNVLTGDMSLVGPRPLAPDEVSRFIEYDVRYHRIFDVKPGITGLWQIGDRNDPSFEYRARKDFEYIADWSFWRDIRIMVATPFAMLRPEK